MERIRKGLYLLRAGGFVNAYLVEGPRGLTLVDTGHARCAARLAAEIEGGGFALKDIEQIVITHSHFDHSGGAALLLDRHRVKVLAHPEDIPVLRGLAADRLAGVAGWLSRLAVRLWFPYRPLDVVVPLRQGEALRALPHWQVMHTPGHTPGSISLYQPAERVLICGDALSNKSGALGLSPRLFNGDNAQAEDTARRLAQLDCDVLCCGHGPVVRQGASERLKAMSADLG